MTPTHHVNLQRELNAIQAFIDFNDQARRCWELFRAAGMGPSPALVRFFGEDVQIQTAAEHREPGR